MVCKGTDKRSNYKKKEEKLHIFINFRPKVLEIREKVVPLQAQIRICSCDVRRHLSKKQAFCIRFALTLSPDIGVWCNGNTTDSGPVILGSSPSTPTRESAKQLSSVLSGFFSDIQGDKTKGMSLRAPLLSFSKQSFSQMING